jgi:hypothetical protein
MTPTNKKKRRKRPTRAEVGPSLEERLTALYSSMGVTAAMARQQMEDPAIKILHEHTAPATKERLEKAKKPKVQAIIYEEFEKFLKQNPNNKHGRRESAGGIHHVVCQRLIRELGRKKNPPIEVDTIVKLYLKKHPIVQNRTDDVSPIANYRIIIGLTSSIRCLRVFHACAS